MSYKNKSLKSIDSGNLNHAQIYATLELAEQQRISNIIALAKIKMNPEGWPEHRSVIYDMSGNLNDYNLFPLRQDIKDALGVE